MDLNKIARKWQARWDEAGIFEAKEDPKKNKFYCLDFFPYPSGSGLHMGHAFNYTIGDIFARFKRMQGFNVLYPMGYDSLGLPAENAAIKEGINPKDYTEKSIKNFVKQQKSLGLSYDWTRIVKTHDPLYYKWDQWIFLKMLEKGLAFKKKAAVNFCSKCNSVLANEQVHNGKCWRHKDTDVEIKQLEQWFFKITDYAEELYDNIDKLTGWADDVKAMQKNWIGKSHGTEINFTINGKAWPIFTTRPDTIFGVTFMVISAQHPKLFDIVTKEQKSEVEKFLKKLKSTSEKDMETMDKEGVFTGSYAINPINNEKIPVYAGNFVIAEYGRGMVMAVPAHDQRDFEFAKKYNIPIKIVIQPKNANCIIVHGSPEQDRRKEPGYIPPNENHWFRWAKKILQEKGYEVFTPEMPKSWFPNYADWKKEFEKIEVNENSILIGHSAGTAFLVRWLGEKQRRIKKLILVAPGKISANERTKELYNFKINDNIKNLADEIIIFISNDAQHHIDSAKIYQKELNGRLIELKNKGHFTLKYTGTEEFPELVSEVLALNSAYVDDGILINSGEFTGLQSQIAIEKISQYLEKKKQGKRVTQYKLKDWLISRQRYWGTPIPIIYCSKCGAVPVPEKNLPVVLPDKVEFGKGNPLATNEKFMSAKCPKCNSNAKRETDTMDTFVNSSWYFLRYCDAKNDKEIFDKKKTAYWMPIDQYIGGKEHACMHLIYFRFYTKFLRDLGLIKFDEPTFNLFNQGMVHGSDSHVMSKSRGNVVLPEEISKKYGIDAARLFLISVASPDKDAIWSDNGIENSFKLLNKVYSLLEKKRISSDAKMKNKMHRTIREITKNIQSIEYNKAVLNLINYIDYLDSQEKISNECLEALILLLSPITPHLSEEMWEKLGKKPFVSLEKWPKFEERYIDDKIEFAEEMISKTIADIEEVLKLANISKPKLIKLIVSEDWKYDYVGELKKLLAKMFNPGEIIKELMKTDLREYGQEISKMTPRFASDQGKLPRVILEQEDELKALNESKKLIESKFNTKVEIELAEKSKEQKAKNAFPGKPAIIVQ